MSAANATKIAEVSKKNQFIKEIILLDDSSSAIGYGIAYKQLLEDGAFLLSGEFHCEPQDMKENVSLVLCSSGTTGLPKGVQLTQYNIVVADASH